MAIGDPRSSAKRARDTVRSIKGTPSELRRDMIKKHNEVKNAKKTAKTPAPVKPPPRKPILLQYPDNIGDDVRNANYIMFTTYKRFPQKFEGNPAQKANAARLQKQIDEMKAPPVGIGDGYTAKQIASAEKNLERVEKGYATAQAVANARKIPPNASLHMKRGYQKAGCTIALYMPPSVTANYKMQYDDAPIGHVSEAIYSVIKDIQGGTQWDEAMSKNAETLGTGLTQMGLKMLDTVVPGAKDLTAMERGTIIAPRTEVMFQGISKRTFTFNFTFIPKSREETETVDKIIHEFKMAMTPAFKSGHGVRELNFPEMFQIAYWLAGMENGYLNKIGRCFLESADVSYGGEKFVTFNPTPKGAPPNKITLALSFREIEIVEQSKIDQGY